MKFDLILELALLPPGHAHNLTDAFFARMNELFDSVKQSSRLVGSQAYAHLLLEGPDPLSVRFPRAFHCRVHAATDSAVTPVRDLITNVTVLHRQLNTPIPPVPNLHGQAWRRALWDQEVHRLQVFPPARLLRRAPIFRGVVSRSRHEPVHGESNDMSSLQ